MLIPRLKESIEQNAAIWFLGALLTGFLSGLGAYKGIQEIAGLKVVPQAVLDESARRNAALKKELAAAKATSDEAVARVKNVFSGLSHARVGLMYIEAEARPMNQIRERLADVGAVVTPNEVSHWHGYPEYVGRLLHRKGYEESAYQLKALVSDLVVATPMEYTFEKDNYDLVLWIEPRK